MRAWDVLGDPVRRRILELLADGERAAGDVTEVVRSEFGISQPAVSLHLRVLRDSGFASMRPSGSHRFYAVDPRPFREIDAWLGRYRQSSTDQPVATGADVAQGNRGRHLDSVAVAAPPVAKRKKHKHGKKRRG